MKSILVTMLSTLYLAFNIGLGINVHYCGDRVSSVDFAFMDQACCCGGEEEMPACCSDEAVVFQTETEQQGSAGVQLVENETIDTGWVAPINDEVLTQFTLVRGNDDPPNIFEPPLFLKFSQLILYG